MEPSLNFLNNPIRRKHVMHKNAADGMDESWFLLNEGMSVLLDSRTDLGQYFEVPGVSKETLKHSLSLSIKCFSGTILPNKNTKSLQNASDHRMTIHTFLTPPKTAAEK